MKKQAGRSLIAIVLALALCIGAAAADPGNMTDIQGHWAETAIGYCMEAGLYSGVSETQFAPEKGMSRAMFVTVLGRLAGIAPEAYNDWYMDNLYRDVSGGAYYAPYVNWATRFGITSGVGEGCFQPGADITREQMATILMRFASIYGCRIVSQGGIIADGFTDMSAVSPWAREAVDSMRLTGIINGYADPDGTYRFGPLQTATRAQCAAVFYRLDQALRPDEGRIFVDPQALELSPGILTLYPGDTASLTPRFSPADSTNQAVTWISSDPSVVRVEGGRVEALNQGEAMIYAYSWNGLQGSCEVYVIEDTPADPSLAHDGETYTEKCMRIFGEYTYEPRSYYASGDTSYLTNVTVQVWDFTDSSYTTKYTKTITLTVHKNIASTVEAIFREIYNGPERFPISYAGGYRNAGLSEHTPGLAIDINANSNYYCDPNGNALTGSHWLPGTDPYSIPLDGDVARAFTKYGFTRGIYWRSGYKDYMHFSYFGT